MPGASDLVGDGTDLHRYVPFTRHVLGERVVRQRVAVPNALGVEEEGVDDVLIHVAAFVVCRHTDDGSSKRSRPGLWRSTSTACLLSQCGRSSKEKIKQESSFFFFFFPRKAVNTWLKVQCLKFGLISILVKVAHTIHKYINGSVNS